MLKQITLEASLKPFKQVDQPYIEAVCRRIYEQWKPMLKDIPVIKLMLWSADGSELLDYRGREEDSFEWCSYIGGANPRENVNPEIDPQGIGLHTRGYLYMAQPPVMTYGVLKRIVAAWKQLGKEYFPDKTILVGTTFDPGPEFAVSSFKYDRHNEVCLGNDMGKATMVCAYARLNGDDYPYAAFPNGIPDGLPFGTFLGKQAKVFMDDMGFDYIWLSNGFGFGRETWSSHGALFDGESFDISELEGVKEDVMNFWKQFCQQCPDYPIEVRGTNMSLGIDMATDGVPLKQIYDNVPGLLPPPNSPWAAINYDFGLELMGYMSRIAEIPAEDYLFRFYIHDPWWMNSPWYDRYNGLPHDIYLPMAVARLDAHGAVKSPTHMNLLTVDNSLGDMPDACVNEPLPHLLKAIKEAPDDVAPVVWVYPFREYSACTDARLLQHMYAQDWYIRGCINHGLPMSMVVSTDHFIRHDKRIYAASVLVTPVPQRGSDFEKAILNYASSGGRVIFYGNTEAASADFLRHMGITNADEIFGTQTVTVDGNDCGVMKHESLICGGGLCSESDNAFATAGTKAIGVRQGNSVWLRGTVSCDHSKGQQLLQPHDPREYFISETLMTKALGMLGYQIVFEKNHNEKDPVIMLHRHNNAYVFSAYMASTTVKTKLKFPLGAPVLDAYETVLEDGWATYCFPKAERRECRVFVEQESGIVGCRERNSCSYYDRRRIEVTGLKNATVRFLAEDYCASDIKVVLNSHVDFWLVGDSFDSSFVEKDGIRYFEARNVTGDMVFSMPAKVLPADR